MSNAFVRFIKAIGRGLKRVGKLMGTLHVVSQVFSEDQFDHALGLIKEAADKFTDNANRRTWVVAKIQETLHLPESLARLLLELAVTQVKNKEAEVFGWLDAHTGDEVLAMANAPDNTGTGEVAGSAPSNPPVVPEGSFPDPAAGLNPAPEPTNDSEVPPADTQVPGEQAPGEQAF